MRRTWAVIKREFGEGVRTKTFVLGTLFGPVIMLAFMVLPVLFMGGGGEREIVVLDASGTGLGEQVAAQLEALGRPAEGGETEEDRTRYTVQVLPVDAGAVAASIETLRQDAAADSIDGFLHVPAGVMAGEGALYEGRNATNFGEMRDIRNALVQAVRERRLADAGIPPDRLAAALAPVDVVTRKVGAEGSSGPPEFLMVLSQFIAFTMYMLVILYGVAVMRGVLEEKRDRIVEIVVSSVRPRELMLGKVLGIGGTGLLQILIWIAFAALLLTQREAIAAGFGAQLPEIPDVPASVAVLLPIYFVGGFFLYATVFAALGATVTTDQEAQQLQFPVLLPLMIGFFMMFAALNDADGTAAVWGTLIPFTAPLVTPVRAALTDIPPLELAGSLALLAATSLAILWIGARIYRVGILATGRRATVREITAWIRG